MIYFFIFITLFILSIKNENKKRDKIFKLVVYFIIFILAFNYKMGTDWLAYQEYYDIKILNYSFKDIILNNPFREERGYIFLNFLGNKLGLNYEFFMAILISFCVINILKVGIKRSKNYYIFTLIIFVQYLLIASLEPTIRQFITVTLTVIGYRYIERKEPLKYFLIILIAIQFHTSAILGVIIYFLNKIDINKKRLFLLIAFIFTIIKILPFIFKSASNIISNRYVNMYLNYFNDIFYGMSKNRLIKGNIFIFIITLIYLYIVFFAYDNSKNKKVYIKNAALIYIVCNYFQNILPILYRVQEYFIVPFAITLSYSSQITFFNKKIIFYKDIYKYFVIIFINILFLFIFMEKIYNSELNKIRYGDYKNYFIEKIKGNVTNNFKEKKKGYEENIKKLLNERIEKMYKELNKK